MKKIFYNFVLVGCFVAIHTCSFARPWNDFVHVNIDNRQYGYGYLDEEKTIFKSNLKYWKQNIDKDIDSYVSKGIKKSFAKKALEERNKLAQKLIDSNFKEPANISPKLDFLDNRIYIMNHVVALGHGRFEKLMEKENIKIDDDFYQCLCNSYSIMGTGIGYSPAPDKHCNNNNPCKGGNFGCVSYDLPSDTSKWMQCSKRYPTKDGDNIFQVLNSSFKSNNKLDEIELRNKMENKFRKYNAYCLPAVSGASKKRILNTTDLTRIGIVREAMNIADKAENLCEESIVVKLYLNSQEGRTSGEVALDLIYPWLPPYINFDKFSITENLIGSPPIISTLSNIKSNIELLSQEYTVEKSNVQFANALQLFQKSSKWSQEEIVSYEYQLQNSIERIDVDMKFELDNLKRQMLQSLPDAKYGPQYSPGAKIPNYHFQKQWDDYRQKNEKYVKLTNARIGKMLYKQTGLLIKKNIISKYRKALNKKDGCKKLLKVLKENCNNKSVK